MRVKLIATEGMIYTNGEAFGSTVFLGNGDSPDNWHQISREEYNRITKEAMGHEKDLYQPRPF